jgi:hypothetical protein
MNAFRSWNRTTLIDRLKKDIAQGRVVTIAGTGVSITACGNQKIEKHPVATWDGLLRHGLEYCRELKLVNEKDLIVFNVQI